MTEWIIIEGQKLVDQSGDVEVYDLDLLQGDSADGWEVRTMFDAAARRVEEEGNIVALLDVMRQIVKGQHGGAGQAERTRAFVKAILPAHDATGWTDHQLVAATEFADQSRAHTALETLVADGKVLVDEKGRFRRAPDENEVDRVAALVLEHLPQDVWVEFATLSSTIGGNPNVLYQALTKLRAGGKAELLTGVGWSRRGDKS